VVTGCGAQYHTGTPVSRANDRLRIAVAGVNGRGKSHINGWLGQDNVEIAYLIDPDRQLRAERLNDLEEKSAGKFSCRGVTEVR